MVRRLLALNGIAVILAVSHHSIVWAVTAMFWWTDRYSATTVPNYDRMYGFAFNGLRLIDQFSQIPVPAFLFVSGYFVVAAAGQSNKTVSWQLVFHRVAALLPPYLLWSFVAMALNVVSGRTYTPSSFAMALLTGGAAAPLYYVPLIVQLYVLSRWLVPLARHRWPLLLIVTGCAMLAVIVSRTCILAGPGACAVDTSSMRWLLNSNLAGYAFWFALGLVFAAHLTAAKSMLRRLRPILPILLAVIFVAAFLEWRTLHRLSGREWVAGGITLGDNLFSLVALLTYFAFDEIALPAWTRIEQVGTMSYGIYLVHVPVIEVAARGLYHAVPVLLAFQLALQVELIVIGVAVPFVLITLIKASPLRRYAVYAFG
jgi:peptidoglycan/LPS O-acetylase OafA/YrhL